MGRRWAKGGLGLGLVVMALACGTPAEVPEVQPPAPAPAPVAADPTGDRREGRERRRRKKREPTAAEHACDLQVYVGPGGGPIELRDAPDGAVLATWPAIPAREGASKGPLLEIVGATADGDWFEVASARDLAHPDRTAGGPTAGWVRRDGLAVNPVPAQPGPRRLRDRPSPEGAVVRSYQEARFEAPVLDCDGGWVEVRVTFAPGDGDPAEGWLAPGDYCDDPVTECHDPLGQ